MVLPLAFAQESTKPNSSDKVTTDDSVFNPNGGPGDKASDDAKTKAPKDKERGTPPNGPVTTPSDQNPAVPPAGTPKEGNLPKKGNLPEKK
jgi:hypothetical protein